RCGPIAAIFSPSISTSPRGSSPSCGSMVTTYPPLISVRDIFASPFRRSTFFSPDRLASLPAARHPARRHSPRPTMHPRERLAFPPIDQRPPPTLPDGLRLIVWPLLALEEWDMARPMARMVISPPQGQPMLPDHPNWSWHEYGMRVGFWRLKR